MKIENNYIPERTSFTETMLDFNKKFHNTLTLTINENFNSKMGLNLPEITTEIHNHIFDTDNHNISDILSSGELNSLAMLQLYILINNNSSQKKLIIIDDEQEVFDYAFKYGFIEYMLELMEDKNNKIIILSHNYDFIKSINNKSSIGNLQLNCYTAYVKNKQDIKIEKITKFPQFNLSNKEYSINDLISHIPFARNIAEFIYGKHSEVYSNFTEYLHYKDKTEELKFSDLINNYKNINCVSLNDDLCQDKLYLETLFNNCNIICVDYKGNHKLDIELKVILSIGIRLKFEKLFIETIKDEKVNSNQTRMIFNNLSDANKIKFSSVLIITPDYIHINAFECSPLADVKIDRFIDLYIKLCEHK